LIIIIIIIIIIINIIVIIVVIIAVVVVVVVCPEKETKLFFCNIFYETSAILMNFGTCFPEEICCKII